MENEIEDTGVWFSGSSCKLYNQFSRLWSFLLLLSDARIVDI
jgi:hypothetical protein